MTYIEIINRFWKIHQFDHFSSAEIAVYFYLLNMANRNMWEDEIAVATAELCASIGMRRSTIIRARQSLREKGLIECREGVATPARRSTALSHPQPLRQPLRQPLNLPLRRPYIKIKT